MLNKMAVSDGKLTGEDKLSNLSPGSSFDYSFKVRVAKEHLHEFVDCAGTTSLKVHTSGWMLPRTRAMNCTGSNYTLLLFSGDPVPPVSIDVLSNEVTSISLNWTLNNTEIKNVVNKYLYSSRKTSILCYLFGITGSLSCNLLEIHGVLLKHKE